MNFLLDTNVLIYFFKDMGQVRNNLSQHKDSQIKICSPVYWEFMTGVFKATRPTSQQARLDLIKDRFEMLLFDEKAAVGAAKIRAQLELAGTPIGPIDTMIAGIALANNLTLVTRNMAEFERVENLKITNWF